jgi:hypothetical protein
MMRRMFLCLLIFWARECVAEEAAFEFLVRVTRV